MSNEQYDLQELVEAYVADPTERNKEAVVISAVPLVRSLIGKMSIPDHPLASREDVENVALMGLLEALEQYDPDQGTAFASYAYGRIRGSVVDYLRSIDVLPRRKRRKVAEARKTIDQLSQTLGHRPSDEQVADELGLSVDKYHSLLRDAQRRFALSLHQEQSEDGNRPVEVLPNPNTRDVRREVEHESLVDHVGDLINELPERQQTIVGLYYFENLTLREIGSLLDLSEARISQILGKIMLTLRSQIEGEPVES